MDIYKSLLRPLLFRLPPERAHHWANLWLRVATFRRKAGGDDPRLRVHLPGLSLPNPIGLAAGYDKDCRFLPHLLGLGFGYVVGGTVTYGPRRGHPRPRVLRYPQELSLVNAMGFPNPGAERVVQNLKNHRKGSGPFLVSLAGETIEEMAACHRLLEPWVDGVEVNISSPNSPWLRDFHRPQTFSRLLERLNEKRNKPLWIKIPPYFEEEEREGVLRLVLLAQQQGVDGITAINTRPIEEPRLSLGRGGLSGKRIFADMLRIVREVYRETGGKVPINACGGMFGAADVLRALEAGATTVQIYTGLVYEGPGLVGRIKRELVRSLEERGMESLSAVVGSSSRY